MATIIEDNVFFCESECLYVEKLTYVQQIEIQKTQWSLTAILMKDKYLCDNKYLYVEETTYSKLIKTKKMTAVNGHPFRRQYFFVKESVYI
jgi:hypothetical protein